MLCRQKKLEFNSLKCLVSFTAEYSTPPHIFFFFLSLTLNCHGTNCTKTATFARWKISTGSALFTSTRAVWHLEKNCFLPSKTGHNSGIKMWDEIKQYQINGQLISTASNVFYLCWLTSQLEREVFKNHIWCCPFSQLSGGDQLFVVWFCPWICVEL